LSHSGEGNIPDLIHNCREQFLFRDIKHKPFDVSFRPIPFSDPRLHPLPHKPLSHSGSATRTPTACVHLCGRDISIHRTGTCHVVCEKHVLLYLALLVLSAEKYKSPPTTTVTGRLRCPCNRSGHWPYQTTMTASQMVASTLGAGSPN